MRRFWQHHPSHRTLSGVTVKLDRSLEGMNDAPANRKPETRAADAAREASLAVAERGRAQALLFLMRQTAGDPRSRAGRVDSEPPSRPLEEGGQRLAEAVSRSGAASLSYVFTGSGLVTWLITPSGEVIVRRQPTGRDSVSALVGAYRCALAVDARALGARLATRSGPPLEPTNRGGTRAGEWCDEGIRWQDISAELGRLLVPRELPAHVPAGGEVIVVPSGPLALVPYAALLLPEEDALLGERYALRYAPSLTTLVEAQDRQSRLRTGGRLAEALVVGDPTMPVLRTLSGDRVEFAALPAAAAEARWLAQLLEAKPLTADAASEAAVKARLPDVPIAHLATHGYAYSEESMARESFVALATGGGEDGLLTVGEIIDGPSLTAELVVLSACQTGLGNLKNAEGTVGLQRAFLAKGARSVLVSLWSVSDAATDRLMRAFYAHWLEDAGRAEQAGGATSRADRRASDGRVRASPLLGRLSAGGRGLIRAIRRNNLHKMLYYKSHIHKPLLATALLVTVAWSCRPDDAATSRSSDSDGDGVPEISDLCPSTPPDVAVDAGGCRMALASDTVLSRLPGFGGSDTASLRPTGSVLPSPGDTAPPPGFVRMEVFYGTDRKPVPTGTGLPAYGKEIDSELHLGSVVVSIPKRHAPGAVETPSLSCFGVGPDPAEHVALLDIQLLDRPTWVTRFRSALENSTEPEALVYIHGYKRSFRARGAHRRTAGF